MHTEDAKDRIGKASRERWQDEETRMKMMEGIERTRKDSSRLEKVKSALSETGKKNKGREPWNKGKTFGRKPRIRPHSQGWDCPTCSVHFLKKTVKHINSCEKESK